MVVGQLIRYNITMLNKTRAILALPFILLSAMFKIIAISILPKEHREEGKKVL